MVAGNDMKQSRITVDDCARRTNDVVCKFARTMKESSI
jgi:hypothetical protein